MQRRPRLVRIPARLQEDLAEQSAVGDFESDLPGRQNPTLRIIDIRQQPACQITVLSQIRRGRQTQHIRGVQVSDGNDPSAHAPGADGRGQPLSAQRPGPAEVSRMELQGRAVVLPYAEGIHGPGQSVDAGLVQNDRHVPHLTTARRPAAPGLLSRRW